MSKFDAGYDFIEWYSDEEVTELYKDRVSTALERAKEGKLESSLAFMEDAAYYSGVLQERQVPHEDLDYDAFKQVISGTLEIQIKKHLS